MRFMKFLRITSSVACSIDMACKQINTWTQINAYVLILSECLYLQCIVHKLHKVLHWWKMMHMQDILIVLFSSRLILLSEKRCANESNCIVIHESTQDSSPANEQHGNSTGGPFASNSPYSALSCWFQLFYLHSTKIQAYIHLNTDLCDWLIHWTDSQHPSDHASASSVYICHKHLYSALQRQDVLCAFKSEPTPLPLNCSKVYFILKSM